MPNLLDTVQDLNVTNSTELVKDRKALDLQASSSRESKVFKFVTVDLLKVPSLSAGVDDGPLCIDLNVNRLRRTSTGFVPKLIIVSGADILRAKKKAGDMTCRAWVGERAIAKSNIVIGSVPESIAAGVSMLQMIHDGRNFESPALGGYVGNNPASMADAINYGAPGSELNNPMLKLMLNVEDALAMYQSESAEGVHKVVYSTYAPIPSVLINAAKEAKIAAADAGMNLDTFSAFDFLKWQDKKLRIKASNRVKVVAGTPLEASAFAYVGLPEDISTWHLPMHTNKAAQRSYNICAATHFVPKKDKPEALANLKRTLAAGGPGSGKHKGFKVVRQYKDAGNSWADNMTMSRHVDKTSAMKERDKQNGRLFDSEKNQTRHIIRPSEISSAGNPGSGATKNHSKQPHSFKIDTDTSKCKTCGMAESHPLHKVISAGGPGSGRKPSFQSDTPRKAVLDNMHNDLKEKGFKYKSSHQSGIKQR